MAVSSLPLSFIPYCMTHDPGNQRIYVGGYTKVGANYSAAIAAIDTSTRPMTILDTHFYDTGVSPYNYVMGLTYYNGYLYAGGGKPNPYRATAFVRKIQADNLSNVVWTYTKSINPSESYHIFTDFFIEGSYVYGVGFYSISGGAGNAGWHVRLDESTGAEQWINPGLYSGCYSVMDAGTYLHVFGSGGGLRTIWRVTKTTGSYLTLGDPGARRYYSFNWPCERSGKYYVPGRWDGVPGGTYTKMGLAKIDKANLSAGSMTFDWQEARDFSPGAPYSYQLSFAAVLVPETTPPYNHGILLAGSYSGTATTYEKTGIYRYRADDVGGKVLAWSTSATDGPMFYTCLKYDNVNAELAYYFFISRYIYGPTSYTGIFEVRKLSDGALSNWEDIPISGPTMDQIMKHGKWFNGGTFQGFWLGWR